MSQATISSGPYLNSNLFSNYYLDERVFDLDEWDCDEEAQEAMDELQTLYDQEGEFLPDLNEDPLLDAWVDEVLDVLGFDSIPEATLPEGGGFVDRTLFGSTEQRLEANRRNQEGDAEGLFNRSLAVLEAKQWGYDFEAMFSEQRQYRNASHQIKHYLEKTPSGVSWGILTDGKKWRLYGTKDYEPQTYYEVDLPELLASGDVDAFKRFFVFFRAEAFRKSEGTTFLDEVWSESESAAQELGEDLQDNVFTALRVLGEGFVETNDLAIDPDDDAELSELKEQSLVLLYRLMFILYAESRDLIHPETPSARTEYEENFSLQTLREEVKETIDAGGSFEADFSEYSTKYWGQLEDLFELIDRGEEDLGIPPYNGGLFDPDQHEFLTENEVSNRHIAEVLYLISTTESESSEEMVFADYADLDTRHLGGIYEGLLEHQFEIAGEELAAVKDNGGQEWKPTDEVTVAEAVETVAKGELYVVNDEGERKATGAYYTPDYVVTHIVEETVDPLLDEIRAALNEEGLESGDPQFYTEFKRRVLDLRILDPAMGSGHFLTKATEHLAEAIMAEARELVSGGSINGQQVRREVSKECIYGVDLNEMAVELAKLSMWLETLAADQPLAFLDHHLKAGNSLVGSDIETIEGLESDASADESDQSSLAEFGATREGTIERLMDIYQEFLSLENEDLSDVKEMERRYNEIEEDELRQRLVAMANVRTADDFGVDIPSGAYERMAKALEDDDEWAEVADKDWFKTGQSLAEAHDFFHWKLEFPEAFYDGDGSQAEGQGFDVIVGNPPYLRIQELRKTVPKQADFYLSEYESARGSFDIYVSFTEKGYELLSERGLLGYIEPHKFFQSDFGEGLRKFLSERSALHTILSFGHNQVFTGASVYTCVLVLQKTQRDSFRFAEIEPDRLSQTESVEYSILEADYDESPWIFKSESVMATLDSLETESISLESVTSRIYQGLVTSGDSVYLLEKLEDDRNDELVKVRCQESGEDWLLERELLKPLLKGEDVERYKSPEPQYYVVFPYKLNSGAEPDPKFVNEDELSREYPRLYDYLTTHEEYIRGRESGKMDHDRWYDYVYPKNLDEFQAEKILTPEISYGSNFTYDSEGLYHKTKVYGIKVEDDSNISEKALLAVLNAPVLWFFLQNTGYALRGGYFTFKTDYLNPFPLPEKLANSGDIRDDLKETVRDDYQQFIASNDDKAETNIVAVGTESGANARTVLEYLANRMLNLNESRDAVNLNLPDYLGTYEEGSKLGNLSAIPVSGLADSILTETTETKESLRVGSFDVNRDGEEIIIKLSARYKPDEEDAYETDRWGYTETKTEPALRFSDLDDTQAALVEAFVPYAVEEAGGFANFRETATKTNSLIDRLEELTLPKVDDVRKGVEQYWDAVERAEELDEKIQRTDGLIDELVYELYGLTDEEIEIVEEAVGD